MFDDNNFKRLIRAKYDTNNSLRGDKSLKPLMGYKKWEICNKWVLKFEILSVYFKFKYI